jgi:hypothetical protein
VGAGTLVRWREEIEAQARPERGWTAAARLDAVILTAAMDEASKNAWCREHGVFVSDLEAWRMAAMAALSAPANPRARPLGTSQDRQRIKELERDLLRKDRALAETAALLVLSKKVAAIFKQGEGE